MGREFELKYAADGAALETLKLRYPHLSPITMETTYYDTPDGALSSMHWTLRRRMENGLSVCTLKTPLPDGARGEWEVACSSIEAAIPLLAAAGAPESLPQFTAGGITAVCGARFTRLAGLLETEAFTAELALDQGVLLGGGAQLPFTEVEVELKTGNQYAVIVFAEALAAEFGLRKEKKSKYRRALDLARGEK